jgi:hypothetical protein
LLPALPFLTLAAGFAFRSGGQRVWLKGLAACLLAWSLIATWGLTLAEQAFPADDVLNPLVDYAWPHWREGNLARNVGTILGLRGAWSLTPLLILAGLAGAAMWWHRRSSADEPATHTGPVQPRVTRG